MLPCAWSRRKPAVIEVLRSSGGAGNLQVSVCRGRSYDPLIRVPNYGNTGDMIGPPRAAKFRISLFPSPSFFWDVPRNTL